MPSLRYQALFVAVLLIALFNIPIVTAQEALLSWDERRVLAFPVAGVVEAVLVKPGQRVSSGELLARLDQRPFKLARKRARAALARIEAQWQEAVRELERAEELYERTVLSDVELQRARAAQQALQGSYREAQAERDRAELELGYAVLKAARAGVVVAVPGYPGQVVSPALNPTAVIELASAERLRAHVELSNWPGDLPYIGDSVTLRLSGERHTATVVAISMERLELRIPATAPLRVGRRIRLER